MRFHTIEDILAANQNATDRFTASISGLTEAQAGFKPAPDQWSIAEIVEHVSIVSNGFLRITYKLLKGAEATGKAAKPDLDLGPTALDAEGNQPPKFMAPEHVHPGGTLSIADALAGMQQTLQGFREASPRLEVVDLTDQIFPHPAFGPLNAYQWMILLGEHTDRHRAQIEAIKESSGYPV